MILSSPSSPASSRSSSPSLHSVTDLSDIGSASPVATTTSDCGNVVVRPSALDDSTGSTKPAVAVASAPDSACEETHELLESAQIANLEAFGAKHGRYFFQSDFLTFLVEGTIYRVHGFLFTMMSPYWAQEVARGDRDGSPTSLDNVSVKEIDAFLSTLYPTDAEVGPRTFADWSAVLRLATMWQFKDKRELAIAALEPIASPLQQLVLARAHDVEAWIHPAFVALCVRSSSLSLEEAAQLSLQDVLHITSAREALCKGRVDPPSPEEASAYVKGHIITSSSPSALLRFCSPSTSVTLAESRSTCPSSDLTLSECPTIEEKRTFTALFSRNAYGEALRAIKLDNTVAFCALLADFSGVSKSYGVFSTFLKAVLLRGVSDQAFIAVGTQLLQTVVMAVPLRPLDGKGHSIFDFMQADAKSGIRSCRDGMNTFWSTFDGAIVKHGDFTLAIAHATTSSDRVRGQPWEVLGLKKEDDQVVYEQRSANLRTFFAALAEAGLLEE